jgi:hypothetical protein
MLYVALITLPVFAIGTAVLVYAMKHLVEGYEDAAGFHVLTPASAAASSTTATSGRAHSAASPAISASPVA